MNFTLQVNTSPFTSPYTIKPAIEQVGNQLMFLDDEYPPTPIREELWWWQRTLDGNVIKFS